MRAAIVFGVVGTAMIGIAAFDPDVVMEGPRVRSLVGLLGRAGTRLLYAVIGVVLITAGLYVLFRNP